MSTPLSYTDYNAALNLYDKDGKIQFDMDKEAARQYFLQHVNQKTTFFHDLEEKHKFLLENDYYEKEFLDLYDFEDVKSLYKRAYAKKFRFPTFAGAYKFYTSYALKTFNGENYLERYEDRVVICALYLANGDLNMATELVDSIMSGQFQPATPTFLNAGRKQRGELVSCFLLRTEDSMESISRAINSSLQLSKRGGGVALLLTNLRETGAPIKKVEGQSSGVVPVMKLLEDAFSYANQLGQRNGSGAVYLHAHHPDIEIFLDTKRENADEKIRIKSLSLGIVVPDITFELARDNKDMYLFSPYDVERVYGKPMSDISISEHYWDMVDNPEITKRKIKARAFFQMVADVQIQSGYPYIVFEDTVNKANPIEGRINMSNLCSEILQVNTPSTYQRNLNYDTVGRDISCNLGSLNVARVMQYGNIAEVVDTAMRALTNVSLMTDIQEVPSIANGNDKSHSVGLGAMNLAGYFGQERIFYGSEESIDFTNMFFYTVNYHSLVASNKIAIEKDESFEGFENSEYANGSYFTKYIEQEWAPATEKVATLFREAGIAIPTQEDWKALAASVQEKGLFNAYRLAIPPTGSISYLNYATASIHPISQKIEIRKEGKLGRLYVPAFGLTNDNLEYYQDAYELGNAKVCDVYAAATQHVDQGLSLTFFYTEGATTRDYIKAMKDAWMKGIKTIYYSRIRAQALGTTDVEGCVSCAL